MNPRVPIIQVDAFTERPFAGNPAAVCLLKERRPEAWMQAVAREMNLSETAFVVSLGEGFDLRWFTPTVEIDLCGHATLASAHVLWEEGTLGPEEFARFQTKSGPLTCRRAGNLIEMDFPATPTAPSDALPNLALALAVDPVAVERSRFDYLVEVKTEALVRELHPDSPLLRTLPVRGVTVTARASDAVGSGYDFVSRFFAPGSGIDEDPVTGSAHCALAPYWSARLGRAELTGYQASARGGTVHTRLRGERVILGGQAVTVLRGELAPPAGGEPARSA